MALVDLNKNFQNLEVIKVFEKSMDLKVAAAAAVGTVAAVEAAAAAGLSTTTWAVSRKPPTSAGFKPRPSSCEYHDFYHPITTTFISLLHLS